MANTQKVIKVVTPAKADVRKRPAKPGSGLKTAAEKKPAPPLPWWKKVLALPGRVLITGGVAVVLVIITILFLFSGSSRHEAPPITPPTAPPQSAALLPGVAPEQPTAQQAPTLKTMTPEEEDRPTIQAIRFTPPQATRTDTLKATVVMAEYANPGRITHTYVWKVNSRTVEASTGDTLDLSTFKKGDLVTVTVTPHDGDKTGFPMDSPVAVIYGIPPSLDLRMPLKKTRVGESLELQLVSLHPDSDAVTFSLEPPLLPGMSIDSKTGKITWLIPPNQRGAIRFWAAVEDTDKTKVTKTFDIAIE